MTARRHVIALLTPLREELERHLDKREKGDPLELVRERFERLLNNLENEPPTVSKVETLQELAFLAEHSLNDDLRDFHQQVRQAIDATMTHPWTQ